MKFVLFLFITLVFCHTTFAQTDDQVVRLQDGSGSQVLMDKQFFGKDSKKNIVLYLFSEDCKTCRSSFNDFIKENAQLLEDYKGQFELRSIYVMKNGNQPAVVREWQNMTKPWPISSYYDAKGHFSKFVNENSALVITLVDGLNVRESAVLSDDKEMLKEAITQHPLTTFISSKNSSITTSDKADLIMQKRILPGKMEVVIRNYDEDVGEVMSIETYFLEDSPRVGITLKPTLIGSDVSYFKEGKQVSSYGPVESHKDWTFIQNLRLKEPVDGISTQLTDLFTEPTELHKGKSKEEITVYRRVTIQDHMGNLMSYKLYKGYDDELLEEYDLSDQPRFEQLKREGDGEINLSVEITEETDVEEIVEIDLDVEVAEETEIEDMFADDSSSEEDSKPTNESTANSAPADNYYTLEGNPTTKEKARLIEMKRRLPGKELEMVRLVEEGGGWAEVLSLGAEIDYFQPKTGLLLELSESDDFVVSYVVENEIADEFSKAETYVRITHLNNDFDVTEDKSVAPYFRVEDFFTRTLSGNDLYRIEELAKYRLVTLWDKDYNLLSYKLYKGYEDELLEDFDMRK